MVKVNGAYKYSMYEKNRLKSLCIKSNVKVFATFDRQLNREITASFLD